MIDGLEPNIVPDIGFYCERSEAKRSELARELPVAVECTI